MIRHLTLIRAVFRKDFLSLWPLIALVVAIQVLHILASEFNFEYSPMFRPVTPYISALAACVLVLLTIHQDAVTDARHDGLTRPIPVLDLLAAKAILIWASVFLPTIVGIFIAGINDGRSLVESLQLAIAIESEWMVTFVVLFAATAVVTSTVLQAAGVLVGLFVLVPIMDRFVIKLSTTGEAVFFLGSGWVILKPLGLLAVVGLLIVTWLQYRRRDTARARSVFAACVLTLLSVPSLFTWNRVLTVQRLTEKEPRSSAGLTVRLATECLPSIVINPRPASAADGNNEGPVKISPAVFGDSLKDRAGANAVIFATPIVASGAPDGWIAKLSYAGAAFLDDKNEVIQESKPAVYGPRFRPLGDQMAAIHFWLLSRDQHSELAARARNIRVDYSFALLRPQAYELEIDAQRRYFAHLGFCGAKRKTTGDVEIDCFKLGAQPSAVSVEWKGVPASREFVGDADYTPAWLSFAGGQRRSFTLESESASGASSVIVTAFDVRSFAERHIDVPGGLGNAVSNCPLNTK